MKKNQKRKHSAALSTASILCAVGIVVLLAVTLLSKTAANSAARPDEQNTTGSLSAGSGEQNTAGNLSAGSDEQNSAGNLSAGSGEQNTADSVTLICRIMSGADTGNLLLAAQDGTAELYALNITEQLSAAAASSAEELKNGMLLQITHAGMILESYPAQFGGISEILVLDYGMDNLGELYLNVLNDLWETDSGLNDDITMLGIDLSATRLTPSEQAAVAWVFGNAHGLETIQGNMEELQKMGYIDDELLQWNDGCLFSIAEQTQEGTSDLNAVHFDAQKWRSGDGAYFFLDCTAVQAADGAWGAYSVGGHAISCGQPAVGNTPLHSQRIS